MQFKSRVENLTLSSIKTMINDNGGEYTSKPFDSFVQTHGILMNPTAPYTPQQNPGAEIGNHTTFEKSRALLKTTSMPNKFWAESFSTVVYMENITPIYSRIFLTPHEL